MKIDTSEVVNSNDELYHYGRLGMKWYKSIFGSKNKKGGSSVKKGTSKKKKVKDMSNTELKKAIAKVKKSKENAEMRKQLEKEYDSLTNNNIKKERRKERKERKERKKVEVKKRSIKDMSDDELRTKTDRLILERNYSDLLKQTNPQTKSRGNKLVSKLGDAAFDTVLNAGKNVGQQYLEKKLREKLSLSTPNKK